MFAKSNQKVDFQKIDWLHSQAVAKHKQGEKEEAISYYQEAIKIDEEPPVWVYGNTITLMAQLGYLDRALELGNRALKIHGNNDEIFRAISIALEQKGDVEGCIDNYRKALEINQKQPKWLYVNLANKLIDRGHTQQAQDIIQQGLLIYPELETLNILQEKIRDRPEINLVYFAEKLRPLLNEEKQEHEDKGNDGSREDHNGQILLDDKTRKVPEEIETRVNLDISQMRRALIDVAIVEQFETLLSQKLIIDKNGVTELDTEALLHCLAEIKTDIYYLKTKALQQTPEDVDPQAKNIVLPRRKSQPILIKCDLRRRIIGNGWHEPDKNGRWTGPTVSSSLVLPYPSPGPYQLEMLVLSEVVPGLLSTLKLFVNDKPLELSIHKTEFETNFSAIVNGEVVVEPSEDQHFMAIDLVLEKTVSPSSLGNDDRRILGILISHINLIPLPN